MGFVSSKSNHMKLLHYQQTVTVPVAVTEAFRSITRRIPDWWSADFIGLAEVVNDTFTIRFGNTWKTFRIQSVIPGQTVTWLCEDAYIDMAGLNNKAEWKGTRITWQFSGTEEETTIHMVHEGLTPEIQCYAVCEKGWGFYMNSLVCLLKDGTGAPFIPRA